MHKEEKIINLIEQADEEQFFIGQLDGNKINEIENYLDVKLPKSFKWFLKEYGLGGVSGVKILGGGLSDIPACVKATIDWRNYGLPDKFVVIEDIDEWLYCLDTSQMTDEECPVVDWYQNEGVGSQQFSDFYDFLIQRFSDMLEV